jgi:hypothetical protein
MKTTALQVIFTFILLIIVYYAPIDHLLFFKFFLLIQVIDLSSFYRHSNRIYLFTTQ